MDDAMGFVRLALAKIQIADAMTLAPTTGLNQLDLDSLETLEMVMELEGLTHIQIEPVAFSDCATLQDLADKLVQLQNVKV